MGLALSPNISANGLVWAQNWPQTMLSMSLHGPNTSLKALSRWPCMGPAHTPKIATGDLAWAQTAIKLCYRCACMGPALSPNISADALAWAQHS